MPSRFELADQLVTKELSASDWRSKFEDLNQDFSDKINGYAQQLVDGEISQAQFRRLMENTIRATYDDAYQMGASVQEGQRAILTDAERAEIGDQVSEEFRYLRGFVGDLRDMSSAAILARADMYADGLRSLYWRGWLSRGNSSDYLYDYRSQSGACPECEDADASGPYELEDCPIPGEVCEGYSRCRCEVVRISRAEAGAG